MIGSTLTPLGGNATVVVGSVGTNGGGIELVGSVSGGGNISGMGNGGLTFSTFTGTVGSEIYTHRARIDAAGNFGIATAAAFSTLDVNGVISARTAFSTAGSAAVASLASNGAISGTTATLSNATGPQLTFNGATSNFITFGTVGDAAPAFTTRSVGTKVVYESNITAISTDYAAGVVNTSTTAPLSTAPGTLWWSVPAANILHRFQWYGGTTALATLWGNGNLAVTGEVTAYFSDARLKDNIAVITDAVDKVKQIRGVYYHASDAAVELLGEDKTVQKVGLLAQEVEAILPNVIRPAPFDVGEDGVSKSGENYLTLQYERVIPLLVEAIKELKSEVDTLKARLDAQ
jgi:hypothetical protein